MVRGVFCSSQQLKAFVANTELIFALVMYVCSSWGISPKYVNPHKAVGCQLFAVEVEGTAPISLFTVLRNPLPATVGSLVHAGPKALLGRPIDHKKSFPLTRLKSKEKGESQNSGKRWIFVDLLSVLLSVRTT